jgi:hypothetical protein
MVLFVWQNGTSWYRMVNPHGKFSEPGFPHNFAENYRQDLKMGCTDASTGVYCASKIGRTV